MSQIVKNILPVASAVSFAITSFAGMGIFAVSTAQAQSTGPVENCPAGWYADKKAKGYQTCRVGPSGAYDIMQIVDLKAGARIEIVSDPFQYPGEPRATFNTRTVPDWWNFILNYRLSPTGGQLQGVANASFYMDTGRTINVIITKKVIPDGTITRLSFPQKVKGVLQTAGQGCFAISTPPYTEDCTRPDDRSKRKFGLYGGGTKALIKDYPTLGWTETAKINTQLSDVSDAIVGLYPILPNYPADRRTYVGVKDSDGNGDFDRVYIFTSTTEHTPDAATKIMTQFGSNTNMMLDGGGSTAFYGGSGTAAVYSSDLLSILNRERRVPTVLAVYAAAS
jgi:hypothetical protein